MGQADLHIHTTYSKDGTTTVRGVLKQASNVGLNVVAITDHDEIRGSLVARELAPQYRVEVIPAMEVSAREGHVLALFIEKPIPAGRSLIETLLRIGEQGGIAIAPHPVNPLPKSLPMEALVAHPVVVPFHLRPADLRLGSSALPTVPVLLGLLVGTPFLFLDLHEILPPFLSFLDPLVGTDSPQLVGPILVGVATWSCPLA